MSDSIIIGAAIVDIPLSPVTPDIFTTHSMPLQRIAMGLGGDAANEALVLARLGHAPALVSVVGRDAPGEFVCQYLSKAGVDVSAVAVREGLDTGINVVLVRPDGERSFITSRNGSLLISPANGAPYADRSKKHIYKIEEGDLCYRLFLEHGFIWGGHWRTMKDYQHFEKP